MVDDSSETPVLPTGGPTSPAAVAALPTVDAAADDQELVLVVTAVNGYVRGLPVSDSALGEEVWPPRIALGAQMLAARVWRRRKTPGGVEVFGDDQFAYVRRTDPDIAMLLDLGDYAKPSAG